MEGYLSRAEIRERYGLTRQALRVLQGVKNRCWMGRKVLFSETEFLEKLREYRIYLEEERRKREEASVVSDGRWYPASAYTGKPWSKEEEREFNRRNPFSRGLAARLVAGLALRCDDDCRVFSAGKPKLRKER